jgi:hypothetical protein
MRAGIGKRGRNVGIDAIAIPRNHMRKFGSIREQLKLGHRSFDALWGRDSTVQGRKLATFEESTIEHLPPAEEEGAYFISG